MVGVDRTVFEEGDRVQEKPMGVGIRRLELGARADVPGCLRAGLRAPRAPSARGVSG